MARKLEVKGKFSRPGVESVNGMTDVVELPKPNLNQNDSEALDYVEGRTHWYKDYEVVQSIGPINITCSNSKSTSPSGYGFTQILGGLKLYIGRYRVVFNGIEYEFDTVPIRTDGSFEYIGFGNEYLLSGDESKDTGEPFFINVNVDTPYTASFFALKDVEHTLAIQQLEDERKCIDDEYISNTFIKQGDLYNARGDYDEPDEKSIKYIENKTHYQKWVIQSNGSGKVYPPNNAGGKSGRLALYGRVENNRCKPHEGHVFEFKINGNLYMSMVCDESDYKVFVRTYHTKDRPYIISITNPTQDRKTKLYSFDFRAMSMKSLPEDETKWPTITAIYKYPDGVKQLDEKFIPDTIARVFTEDDALDLLMETGAIEPLADATGVIYTDSTGSIYTL